MKFPSIAIPCLAWAAAHGGIRDVAAGPDATANGLALRGALAHSPSPACSQPWLVRLAPGTYDLGPKTLQLPRCVDLEGGDTGSVLLTGAGNPVLRIADSSEIRRLGVAGGGGILLQTRGRDVRLFDLSVIGRSKGAAITGIDISGGSADLDSVSATLTGRWDSTDAIALRVRGGARALGRLLYLAVSDSRSGYGAKVDTASLALESANIVVDDPNLTDSLFPAGTGLSVSALAQADFRSTRIAAAAGGGATLVENLGLAEFTACTLGHPLPPVDPFPEARDGVHNLGRLRLTATDVIALYPVINPDGATLRMRSGLLTAGDGRDPVSRPSATAQCLEASYRFADGFSVTAPAPLSADCAP